MKNRFRKVKLYTFIVPIFIFGLAAFSFGCKTPPPKDAELEIWGIFDDSDIYEPLIKEYTEEFKHITIKYHKQISSDYEKDLLNIMASGRGPDIFMLHHTWPARYGDKILAAPIGLMTPKQVQDDFVDVVYNDFVVNSDIVALPLSVDTLALYYNKDLFNTAGIPQPPKTWEQLLADVEKLTIKDESWNIVQAGAALGTAKNINRSTDILSLLMFQSGTQMVNDKKDSALFHKEIIIDGEIFRPGQRSLQFYTDFADSLKSVYTWNTRMHYSIDTFYEGRVAMMFNYSYHIPTIRAKAPYLNFGISTMPQIATSDVSIDYANYWGMAVSRNSEASEEAWKFIIWLTNKENSQKYLEAAKRPTARRDLVLWQKDDIDLGVFAEQSLTGSSWYQKDASSVEIVFADMIESVVLGQATVQEAIDKAANQVGLSMK